MASEITVGGITVPLTHPDKVLFPADGITKADLASYYGDVADRTVAASYGVRARPGAPVATPLSWAELEDEATEPGQFTLATVRSRLDGGTDPWADFPDSRHGLGDAAKRLAKLNA
jgi:DNA primase